MSKYHQRQIVFVRSLLDRPKWYNETITHKNWPLIKEAIRHQKPLDLYQPLPPRIQEIENDMSLLRTEFLYRPFMAKPPMFIVTGVTA
jgi:hypothetical protein